MDKTLSVIRFNFRGYNKRVTMTKDIVTTQDPDVFIVQKHWLTPADMVQLESFYGYFVFVSSTMCQPVEAGVLRGRPYSGVEELMPCAGS